MKVAQLLATIPDALPEEYVRELVQLQANAPAMGWPFVRRRMMGELGPDWQSRFKSFERERGAGRLVGPGASRRRRSTARRSPANCSTRRWRRRSRPICASSGWRWGSTSATTARSRTAEIHAEIADRLREELDYEREAAHMRLYGEILKDEPGVAVPRPIAELSTRRLLTMTWLDGAPILDFAEKAPLAAAQRDRAAHVPHLVRAVLLLRRDPRRPASRQLHGGARDERRPHRQPARFRLRPGVPGAFRQGRHRPLSRAAARRPRAGGRGLSELGLRQSVARDDRGAEPLGALSFTARCSTTAPG